MTIGTTPIPAVAAVREEMRQVKNLLAEVSADFQRLAELLPMPHRAAALKRAKELADKLRELDKNKGGES